MVGISQIPNGSDLWIYQSYGRVVAEYQDNPFLKTLDDYPSDEVMQRVLPMYRTDPAVYGPVFIIGATAVAAVTGESETAGRWAWQIISCFAVLGTAFLLRNKVSTRSMALFLLSPITIYLVIHQAHNDVFVGLAILGGCLMAEKRRFELASICLALAALIKAPSGIALAVFFLWLLANKNFQAVGRSAGVSLATAGLFLFPFGLTTPLSAMLSSSDQVNATSMWNFFRGDWESFIFRPLREAPEISGRLVALASLLIAVLASIVATWLLRHRPAYVAISVALLIWIVSALHTSAWYYAWILPIACLWTPRARLLLYGQASLYFITTQAWLMPVAASLSVTGQLGVIDRSAALLLGCVSITGLMLVVYLIRSAESS